jgi:hypothetical protein
MISNILIYMISLKKFIFTSGVTLLFGVYSFYNIIFHINQLEHLINSNNDIYKKEIMELNKKYDILLDKYNHLEIELKILKRENINQEEKQNDSKQETDSLTFSAVSSTNSLLTDTKINNVLESTIYNINAQIYDNNCILEDNTCSLYDKSINEYKMNTSVSSVDKLKEIFNYTEDDEMKDIELFNTYYKNKEKNSFSEKPQIPMNKTPIIATPITLPSTNKHSKSPSFNDIETNKIVPEYIPPSVDWVKATKRFLLNFIY